MNLQKVRDECIIQKWFALQLPAHSTQVPCQRRNTCTKAGISINIIYTIEIMSDFTVNELFNSLSHETKFFLVSE
jgi:hypothetical protein